MLHWQPNEALKINTFCSLNQVSTAADKPAWLRPNLAFTVVGFVLMLGAQTKHQNKLLPLFPFFGYSKYSHTFLGYHHPSTCWGIQGLGNKLTCKWQDNIMKISIENDQISGNISLSDAKNANSKQVDNFQFLAKHNRHTRNGLVIILATFYSHHSHFG